MKDINKILTKAHFKCNFFYNDAKKQHFFAETCLYEYAGDLCHAFTSLSCSLREKSSLVSLANIILLTSMCYYGM